MYSQTNQRINLASFSNLSFEIEKPSFLQHFLSVNQVLSFYYRSVPTKLIYCLESSILSNSSINCTYLKFKIFITDQIIDIMQLVYQYMLCSGIITPIFLSFFQLISDAGYQGEIGSMSSAISQIEVFSKLLKTHILNFFTLPPADISSLLADFVVSVDIFRIDRVFLNGGWGVLIGNLLLIFV